MPSRFNGEQQCVSTAVAQGTVYKFRFLALVPLLSATSTIRGYAGIRLWNARTGVVRPRLEDMLHLSPRVDVRGDSCMRMHWLLGA